jgi:hypothetical protein
MYTRKASSTTALGHVKSEVLYGLTNAFNNHLRVLKKKMIYQADQLIDRMSVNFHLGFTQTRISDRRRSNNSGKSIRWLL